MILKNSTFTNKCTRCPRLTAFLTQIKVDFPDYYARPVPSFGDKKARLLVVGLAPGMHGANRTGRPFTGDHAGILLYQTLYNHGFSSSPGSEAVTDDLLLRDCRITNAVRCLPPQNKPLGEEVKKCNQFLLEEIQMLPRVGVLVALGAVAHSAILKALQLKQAQFAFGHGCVHQVDSGITMIDSYHCSRYNTQTRRLTSEMFGDVFVTARKLLNPT